jgi:adenine-specific DNA-methyltransferase
MLLKMVQRYKGNLELNWINKDMSLYYEYDEDGNPGKPIWVDKNDIKVSEPRILKLVKEYGDTSELKDPLDNALIRGDNLLALRTLVEMFKEREEKDKVKCVYIDPPYNTGNKQKDGTGGAFEHYDDNLEHSTWLTLMRDRLTLIKKLMRNDGMIFIQIDDDEMAYLKILMDEIFGRNNFITSIAVKMARSTGVKMAHAGKKPVRYKEHILLYAKNKDLFLINPQYIEIEDWDFRYNKIILNPLDEPQNWKTESLKKELKNKKLNSKKEQLDFILNNCKRIIRTAANDQDVFKNTKGQMYFQKIITSTGLKKYAYNGEKVLFGDDKLKLLDGVKCLAEDAGDFWNDIVNHINDLHNEGGVKFAKSKKPEYLIKRIINMSTIEGDLVLDSFLGSGTTAAVSIKLKRKFIGIEMGKHAKILAVERLKKVIDKTNIETRGISQDKDINWKGGGGFRYYQLGDSLINDNKINWSLTYEEIAQALFMNFDYNFKEKLSENVFIGKSGKNLALCIVSKDMKIIKKDELAKILSKLNQSSSTQIAIFTNNGVAIKNQDLPENIAIKKIPETILKKYKL